MISVCSTGVTLTPSAPVNWIDESMRSWFRTVVRPSPPLFNPHLLARKKKSSPMVSVRVSASHSRLGVLMRVVMIMLNSLGTLPEKLFLVFAR